MVPSPSDSLRVFRKGFVEKVLAGLCGSSILHPSLCRRIDEFSKEKVSCLACLFRILRKPNAQWNDGSFIERIFTKEKMFFIDFIKGDYKCR